MGSSTADAEKVKGTVTLDERDDELRMEISYYSTRKFEFSGHLRSEKVRWLQRSLRHEWRVPSECDHDQHMRMPGPAWTHGQHREMQTRRLFFQPGQIVHCKADALSHFNEIAAKMLRLSKRSRRRS